jgi:hypothetical protein
MAVVLLQSPAHGLLLPCSLRALNAANLSALSGEALPLPVADFEAILPLLLLGFFSRLLLLGVFFVGLLPGDFAGNSVEDGSFPESSTADDFTAAEL